MVKRYLLATALFGLFFMVGNPTPVSAQCGWINPCDFYAYRVECTDQGEVTPLAFEPNGGCSYGGCADCGSSDQDLDAEDFAALVLDITNSQGAPLASKLKGYLTKYTNTVQLAVDRRSVQVVRCGAIVANIPMREEQWVTVLSD